MSDEERTQVEEENQAKISAFSAMLQYFNSLLPPEAVEEIPVPATLAQARKPNSPPVIVDCSMFTDMKIVAGYATKITAPKIVEPDFDLFRVSMYVSKISKPIAGPVSVLEPGAVEGTIFEFISASGLTFDENRQLSLWIRPQKEHIGKYMIVFIYQELITAEKYSV